MSASAYSCDYIAKTKYGEGIMYTECVYLGWVIGMTLGNDKERKEPCNQTRSKIKEIVLLVTRAKAKEKD
jgi:hypothetical protein